MRRLLAVILVAGLTLAFAACGASGTGSGGSTPPTDAAPSVVAGGGGTGSCSVVSATGEVAGTIQDNTFDPNPVTLTVGQTVTFTNEDSIAHTITLDDGSCDTGNIEGGASAGMTFSAAGSYPFHCNIHSSMTGTFEVS
jgi:plastocyanin